MRTRINLIIFSAIILIAGCNNTPVKPSVQTVTEPVKNSVAPADTSKPDYRKLVGEYVRADGTYKLQIISVGPDGKLDAAYLNPNPIHVARADWLIQDGTLYIRVELRDVNYPGSTYTLQYFPEDGGLAGKYFQAVDKVTYEVEFVKQK